VKVDVAIVGAGLSGLAAARQLSIHGFSTAVFEADSRVGGRIQSDHHDSGAIMDRGFQLYNPAYPEAARVLDHSALDLRAFSSAVISCTTHGNIKLADPRKIPQ
jgi:phytoene dehydrogenase-like protein